MRTFTSLFFVFIALVLAGCNSSGASESSGQPIGGLSATEIESLCDELHGYAMRTWNGACTEEGLNAHHDTGASCESTRKTCLDETVGSCAAHDAAKGSAKCKAVGVDDIRGCLKATAALAEKNYGKDVTCATGLMPATDHPSTTLPKSCQTILDNCQELVAMDMGPGGGSMMSGDDQGDESGEQPASTDMGPCPAAVDVNAVFSVDIGKPVMFHNVISNTCSYGPEAGTDDIYITYQYDRSVADFTADETTKMTDRGLPASMPLDGIGDKAFYLSSMPGAPVSTKVAVLQGTTEITIAAPASLEKVEALMRFLLKKL